MPASSAKKGLSDALLAIQKAGIVLKKDSLNPHFRNTYASLGAVLDALKPYLDKHDLLLTQQPTALTNTDQPALLTELRHVPTGETIGEIAPLILDRDNMQGYGSAITYMRRYALVGMFSLDADEDDDANAASEPPDRRMQTDKDLDELKAAVLAKAESEGFIVDTDLRGELAAFAGLSEEELDDARALQGYLKRA